MTIELGQKFQEGKERHDLDRLIRDLRQLVDEINAELAIIIARLDAAGIP